MHNTDTSQGLQMKKNDTLWTKGLCVWFLVITLTFLIKIPVFGQIYQEENPETGYSVLMDDAARLLSGEEKSQLKKTMWEISNFGNVGFVSVSNHSFSSELDFADAYYHDSFGKESGTIFVIDMKLRKITVFCDGEIYRTVTKAYSNTITDNVYTYASRGEYESCAQEAFEEILSLLNGRRIAQPMKYLSNLFLAMIVALLFNYMRARLVSGASSASDREWLEKLDVSFALSDVQIKHLGRTKKYIESSSDSGGGSGGGSSGGGGSHSF